MAASSVAVVHAHPGRVRLKVPRIKEEPGFGKKLEQLFGSVSAVKRVEAIPLTGSLLILYDLGKIGSKETLEALEPLANSLADDLPEFDVKDFAAWLGRVGDETKPRSRRHNPGPTLRRRGVPVRGRTLKLLLPATLAALGLHALATAPTPVPWHQYLWMAFSSYFTFHPRQAPPPDRSAE